VPRRVYEEARAIRQRRAAAPSMVSILEESTIGLDLAENTD
jgi:hypothetical protein